LRIDLHVHSSHSTRPSQWFLQKIGCPESFTAPGALYRMARERGMERVTITDHNRISGVAEIAHLPGVFVSEEITTYFPENGCKVHVLAWEINEAQHAEIQKVRESIFDLVPFLRAHGIHHAVAHPLYAINDRLTSGQFEKLLLLFDTFEANGARSDRMNQFLTTTLAALTPEIMEVLSNRHDLAAVGDAPWRKQMVGGSDDHSGLNIARTYTEVPKVDRLASFFKGVADGKALVRGDAAVPQTMAHNLYGIAYQFYRDKFGLQRVADKDVLINFLDYALRPNGIKAPENGGVVSRICLFINKHRRSKEPKNQTLQTLIQKETRKLLQHDPELLTLTRQKETDPVELEQHWFAFANKVTHSVFRQFADHLMDHVHGANVFNIFHSLGSAGGLYTLMAPYFIAYNQFTKDRHIVGQIEQRLASLGNPQRGGDLNVAHFTDTFYEVNGVALTMQRQVRVARKHQLGLTVVTCHDKHHDNDVGVRHFPAVGAYSLPEYPELKIFYPPLLEMLDYCYRKGFNQIHSATPGPVGLAALAIARMLKLPISGTYHTQIPQYAKALTGDQAIEDLTWKYTVWYYDQMDLIKVPSQSTKDELVRKGISPEKIQLFPRGINIKRFNPVHRNGFFSGRYGISDDRLKLLYVGRVSREKNLPVLVEAFQKLITHKPKVHLVVVGDGPYRPQMQAVLKEAPATFTGYLQGDDLAQAYASADLFVFPSTTDTFGNVVLEAQSSGLPVIVTDKGGPCENMVDGETGLIVPANSAYDLHEAMAKLVLDTALNKAMGVAARNYMAKRSFEAAFMRSWELNKHIGRLKQHCAHDIFSELSAVA
jgi:glycosyltransferase involved in cell wall biosynthesis